MALEELREYQRRHPKGCYFLDLRVEQRQDATRRLKKSLDRARVRRIPITPQRLAAMVASAASLSKMTAGERSAKGRMMRATQGGYAVQRRYRMRGVDDPTRKATYVRLKKQGNPEAAQRFLERQRGTTPADAPMPTRCEQFQALNPLRPGAPPMTVTIGSPTAVRIPSGYRRARIAEVIFPDVG
jgi:hypothetical protein